MELTINDLWAGTAGKQILRGVSLSVKSGEIHALMGPNGSGKSTLANVLMGNPAYEVTGGEITLDGEDVLAMEVAQRARAGLFLAFQYPVEIPGVTVGRYIKRVMEKQVPQGQSIPLGGLISQLRSELSFMGMDQEFINRYLNQGFSGGEKKRMEMLQMLMMKPRVAILDETDSGLDIDALKLVASGVNRLRGESFSALIITHYQRILDYIHPDHVHVLYDGRLAVSGGPELVVELEKRGYDWVRGKNAQEVTHAEVTGS